uniref:ATP synthase F0 subunit 8 n=1 Tax=Faxonius punctimanus TaxID=2176015 RepID=A0A1B1UZA6_9EUCA|nr:ATP synthase F0 subunit 8 [Faxonius punctimanus]ANW09549.1 ATP synthase F0 subunit 8 [Faxonius punctimanus]
MPQMSPLFWMNLYMMFLLSLILVLVVQYFLVIYCKLGSVSDKDEKLEKLWKW